MPDSVETRVAANQVEIRGLQDDIEVLRADMQVWRSAHEHREEARTNQICQQIIAVEGEVGEMRKSLINRLPIWVAVVGSIAGGTIGVLITIVVMLTQHFIK